MSNSLDGFAAFLSRRYQNRSTPKHYLSDLRQFLAQLDDTPLEVATAQDVDAFIDAQLARGLRATTINRRLASIYAFYDYLADEQPDRQVDNPVRWRRHRLKTPQLLPRDASDADVGAVFAQITDIRDKALFGLMVGSGLRVGEIVILQCADLETITEPTACVRLLVRGKGEKERVAWVTPSWSTAIAAWLQQRPASSHNALFLNQHKRPLSVAGVQYRLRSYCKLAEVQITCHQLRHTFARRLADQGMPTESIADLLGHSQITTTQRYTAGANPDLRDAFLAAMATVSVVTSDNTEQLPTVPRLPRQQRIAEPRYLVLALDELASLPEWLSPTLQRYYRQRWKRWQPHMVTRVAPVVAGRLRRLWYWLVTERSLSGWSALKRDDVAAFIAQRQADRISAKTIRNDLALFKSCVRFALDEGVPISPAVLRIKPPVQSRPLPRYLTTEQIERLLATVNAAHPTPLARAWFLTLTHTGIRSGELLNLRLSDLDLSQMRLFVPSGKLSDERLAYLTPPLADALRSYLTLRPTSQSDALWLNPDGSTLTYTQMNYQIGCWGKMCDVPVSAHRLRHTFATQLVNHGMPLQAVAKLLGHRSLNMTQHYARLYEATIKQQFETATAHIEGYLAIDWPQRKIPVADPARQPILPDSV